MTAKKMLVTNDKGQTYECFVKIPAPLSDHGKYVLAEETHNLRPPKRPLKKPPKKDEPTRRVFTIKTRGKHWLWRTSKKTDRLSSAGVCFSGLITREDK